MAAETLQDYYATLGVPRHASHDQIKKAYRRMAFACHPDRGGTTRRMRAVNEAWEILGDPEARRHYDAATLPPPPQNPRAPATPSPAAPASTPTRSRDRTEETIISEIGAVAGMLAYGIGRTLGATARLLARMTSRSHR